MTQILDKGSRFLAWWLGELSSLIPEPVSQILKYQPHVLTIEIDRTRAILGHRKGNRWREIGRIELTGKDPAIIRGELVRLMGQDSLRAQQIVLYLPSTRVLRRSINLPLAAAENLREVLGFEIDRHTPFKVEEVYYDFRIAKLDREARRVTAIVTVATKTYVDQALVMLKSWGVTPIRVGVADEQPEHGETPSLLSLASNSIPGARLRKLSGGLAITACLLAAIAAYLPLYQEKQLLAAYETKLEAARGVTAATEKLKKQVAGVLERNRFLAERKLAKPTITELLDEVTRRIPDDSWVMQFRAEGDEIVLTGNSPHASALIRLLEGSEMLEQVRFGSPVTFDQQLGGERFTLSAAITHRRVE
ncbi:MAG: fimbrial assembly protein [Rhodospirillales bacterium]|nr:fimbrial assembly protein [Rhodospirillales bacterium]